MLALMNPKSPKRMGSLYGDFKNRSGWKDKNLSFSS